MMRVDSKNETKCGAFRRHRQRLGIGLLDSFVSFTLLVTLISFATPLLVRHAHVLKSHRNYRLALDELSNQLDRLANVPFDRLPMAIDELAPSAFVVQRLAGAKLEGELTSAEVGTRVTLKLSWNEPGRNKHPVSLAAWLMPLPLQTTNSRPGEAP
jgi:hypothetical protein